MFILRTNVFGKKFLRDTHSYVCKNSGLKPLSLDNPLYVKKENVLRKHLTQSTLDSEFLFAYFISRLNNTLRTTNFCMCFFFAKL